MLVLSGAGKYTLPLAVCGLLLSILAACSGPGDSGSSEGTRGGPNTLSPPTASLSKFMEGHVFSDAFVQIRLTGNVPGTLRSVEILGGDGYFELTGLKVAGEERKFGSIQMAKRFPPKAPSLGPIIEGAGASLPTGSVGTLLLVGMRVTQDGIGSRTGLRVRYSVDGKDYYQDHPAAVVNCPPGTPQDECDAAMEQGLEDAIDLAG